MGNAYTDHSRKLRSQSASKARDKAIAEGRVKRKTFQAPTEVIDTFMAHMDAAGGQTEAEKLSRINEILNDAMAQKK